MTTVLLVRCHAITMRNRYLDPSSAPRDDRNVRVCVKRHNREIARLDGEIVGANVYSPN
jgi:hypothetical protein